MSVKQEALGLDLVSFFHRHVS